MLPKTLKGFTAFVDGYGQLGVLTGGTPPKLALKMEKFRDGGMDAEIELDMGMEALSISLEFAQYDPLIYANYGLLDGTKPGITLRGSAEAEDGTTEAIIHECRGTWKELDSGEWKGGGEKASLKLTTSLIYYRLTIGGTEVMEIDMINGTRVIGGVDQLATRRRNLGL